MENIVVSNNVIMFTTITPLLGQYDGRGRRIIRNFIYDFSKAKLSSVERITPDKTNSFLPIYTPSYLNTNVFDIEDKFLYFNVSSLDMFAAKKATESKNPQYPPVLQEYFRTQSRKSNPVIVRMKLKEN